MINTIEIRNKGIELLKPYADKTNASIQKVEQEQKNKTQNFIQSYNWLYQKLQ